MFAGIKKSGPHQYVQIVENRREGTKVVQRVVSTLGRLDRLNSKGDIESIVRSLSRFSDQVLMVISGKSELLAEAKKIGPALIFERLWAELGIGKVLRELLANRLFSFDVERAVFLTVLHRLMVCGSDRFCDKWRSDYLIRQTGGLSLHHLYRAMAFLGEETEDQKDATPFSPRCTKDLIEERLFRGQRHLFTGLDLVFFDTTSLYFEGQGGESLGKRGFSKDHRPDLNQMVVGAILDSNGRPICCEMWPGNTTDVKTLLPVAERIKQRFQVARFCLVADRGMISRETLAALDDLKTGLPHILGVRMRKVKEVREEVLSDAGDYREVHTEGKSSKDPSPLKVKEVKVNGRRYIVCLNSKQARKDKADREAIIASLEEQLKGGAKKLVGNRGYRRYVKTERDAFSIDYEKMKEEERFDGKWVLTTNTHFTAEQAALKYKELWQVEQVFRDAKSLLETRPVFHQRDDTIRGHVFCSFLALLLKKELYRRIEAAGHSFEWSDIKQDLRALQQVVIEEEGKRLAIRTECRGTCGKVFQAVGVAIPPAIRHLEP
ncbi:IS1634 family transposase [Desulfoferrobacter suflitae]|uniref:IS1634 family transposase n=1 Tax=Desulfoferrobacter suflitae TaxID=2865782 RepID=UPI002164BB6B|nr:IS1634 family transposase [Desulfoferrobacter suflitae]MCK8604305.1 IS1634 family transposase [Desulfoferrobacter suflitae]